MLERFLQQWAALAPRDRRVILLGTAGLVVIFGYFVLFEPAWKGRQQLQAELPVLRSQLASLEGMAAEARRLSAGAAASTGADSLAQARVVLEQSLQSAGIKDAQVQIVGEMIEVRFKSMPYAQWLDWLAEASRQSRLRVVDAQVTRDTAGMASARVALARPQGESRGARP